MPAVRAAVGQGRSKEPIETRKHRSKRPHHARKGPPDVPMADVFDLDQVPVEPPKELDEDEREAWDLMTEQQRGAMNARWIYRSDCAYLIATCRLYGRWMKVKRELDQYYADMGTFADATGNAHPLLRQEIQLIKEYQKSLVALGLVPTRRHVTMEDIGPSKASGFLAH